MAVSAPKPIYGVHNFTFFDRTTKKPTGIVKVLASVNLNQSGSFNDLFGGSSRYPYDSEAGVLDATISISVKEFHKALFQRALGAAVTTNTAEAAGNITTAVNTKGTSLINATTGVAAVEAISGSEADLKDGRYVMEAISATTVKVYGLTDVDFDKGTDKAFADDDLSLTAAAITIVSTTDTAVTGFGFQLAGGSGTIALVTGDTATFEVRKINTGSEIISVGSSTQAFEEFGCVFTSQKQSNGNTLEFFVPRCKAIGLPINLTEQAWATSEVQMKALYDSAHNLVYQARRIAA